MREPKTSSFLRFVVAGGSSLAVLCIVSSRALAADPPPPPPPDDKKLEIMAWSRVGATFQSPYDTSSLNKLTANGELDFFAHGKVTDEIGIFGSLIGQFGPVLTPAGPSGAITGNVQIEDVVLQIEPSDYFHLWLGRMLVASDRSNFSGPWHMSPWVYPGLFSLPGQASAAYLNPQGAAPPIGPRQGPVGRNDGATVWGQYAGGLFKYYLGMYNLQDAGGTPLWSGRVSLSLLNPEPGYFNASTYYGAKDIIGLGLGFQVQGNGSVNPATGERTDFTEINFDVLAEKNFGPAGVGTIEGAFYKYGGDFEQYSFSYFVVASYLTPQKIGPGKIQPLLRLQQAKPKADGLDTQTIFDVQAGYVVEGFKARFSIGYENSNFGAGVKGNAVLLGAQIQR
jgi:hypothetical protein